MLDVENKKIAIIGLSRTGVAAAKMLSEHGADVVVSDVKPAEELEQELELLNGFEVEYELGGHGDKCLASEMIVVSPGVPLDLPFFKKIRKNGIPIISEIELAYHFTEAKIIAITGTNGKTTTTSLLGEILKNAKLGTVRVAGNIGTPLISEIAGLSKDDFLVVEISSFQLETIDKFRPNISLYLNFTPDHLDRHKTIDNYWLAKKRIFENQTKDDYAVVNFDDENVMRAVKRYPGEIFNVSLKETVDKGIFSDGKELIISDNENLIKVLNLTDIPLKGRHNVQNVAFAVLSSYLLGVSIDIIKNTVENFKPAAHRLEEVCILDDNILVVDDSKATNPDAAIKALEAFARPIVLIAGGQDRDADFKEWAETVQDKVKTLVLMGETRFKMKDEALKYGFPNINIHIADSMEVAVKIAKKNSQIGDCLLLAPGCPSWDMYYSYQKRGNEFQRLIKE